MHYIPAGYIGLGEEGNQGSVVEDAFHRMGIGGREYSIYEDIGIHTTFGPKCEFGYTWKSPRVEWLNVTPRQMMFRNKQTNKWIFNNDSISWPVNRLHALLHSYNKMWVPYRSQKPMHGLYNYGDLDITHTTAQTQLDVFYVRFLPIWNNTGTFMFAGMVFIEYHMMVEMEDADQFAGMGLISASGFNSIVADYHTNSPNHNALVLLYGRYNLDTRLRLDSWNSEKPDMVTTDRLNKAELQCTHFTLDSMTLDDDMCVGMANANPWACEGRVNPSTSKPRGEHEYYTLVLGHTKIHPVLFTPQVIKRDDSGEEIPSKYNNIFTKYVT